MKLMKVTETEIINLDHVKEIVYFPDREEIHIQMDGRGITLRSTEVKKFWEIFCMMSFNHTPEAHRR